MKIPKVEKLPSGRYRVQVQVGGQRYGETFDTPEEAQFWAAGIKTRIKDARKPARRLTVGEAADQYIERRDAVLSPATVAGYKRIRKNLLPPIAATLLPELTQESIQRWVNRMVKAGKSPKTVANAHGFLSAVLSAFRPDVKLTTRLPQKEKHEIQIPTKAEVQAIAETCRGTKYELPIMLAICLGLRASEIRGLRWSDIDGEYVNIHTAIVEGENGAAEKGPKSYSGARRVHLPAYLRDLLARTPQTDEHITTLTGHAIYCGFSRVCEKAGVPHYRFHDLRHPYVKHTTKNFSLRLMDFQAQAYPDARRKTCGACQLHRGGQSQSPVRPLCNRKRFSCLPPQSKISRILYAISIRLSGYTSTRSISSSASSVVSVSASKIALDASMRLSCRACSSCFCFACANTAA